MVANVALLAEGVGRNGPSVLTSQRTSVALLAEGVGRNLADQCAEQEHTGRPPRGGRG